MLWRPRLLSLLVGVTLSGEAASQTLPLANAGESTSATVCPQVSVEQVVENLVRRNSERAQALPAYRSTRKYRVEYRGFPGSRTAEMVVDMVFAPPGTKVFVVRSQTGSKLIIDRVFKKLLESEKEAFEAENQRRTALDPENYTFSASGCESLSGSPNHILAVEPKIKSKFLYRGRIWVDAVDYAVSRIAAVPAKNPSFWIKQTQIEQVYRKVGDFWLPATNRSVTSVRLGGKADLTIEYQGYELTGTAPLITGAEPISAQR